MIAGIEYNQKTSPIVTELFLGGRKLNISLAFTLESYFNVPKTITLNAKYYFIMKTPNKSIQQIALNHSSDIEFKKVMKLYKDYIKDTSSFLVNDTTLPSHNPFRFRKNQNNQ